MMEDDEYNCPRADTLPLEIITHILEFLPSIEDRKAAALVCKRWYQAYQTPALRKREEVLITTNEIFEQLFLIENPNRIFANICVRGVCINRSSRKFWRKYAEHFRSLSINSCDIREITFVRILSKCAELEALRVHDCRELFLSGLLLESETERAKLAPKMSSVRSLSLGYNRYLSDSHFFRLTSTFRNLQELLLPGCSISFHTALYNRFYQNGHADPSENILTFSYVLEYIKSNASRLKSLSFAETLIDGHATRELVSIENLVLDKLSLRGCVQVTSDAVITLTTYQSNLTHLDIGLCPRLNDDALLTICARLTGLKYLSVQGCRNITDLGVANLGKLALATSLNVSECERLTDEGVLLAFGRRENRVLEELRMSHLTFITDRAIGQIVSHLPNLRLLDVGYCYKGVTDRALQSIFLRSRHLHTLVLTMCDQMTDRGTTGIALELVPVCNNPPEAPPRGFINTENFELPEEDPAMVEYRALVSRISPGPDLRTYSLTQLKHLRSLTLSGCSRITDLTLKFGLMLPDLRVLDLSNCHLVTAEGLLYVSEYAKALEILNLDNCESVDDCGVGHVLRSLIRLKSLTLGSRRITERILEHLGQKTGNLKFLDVRHCQQLTADTVSRIIAYCPHLQVVHFSTKANEFQYTGPPPPPPPTRPRPPFPITFHRPYRLFQR